MKVTIGEIIGGCFFALVIAGVFMGATFIEMGLCLAIGNTYLILAKL